MTGACTIPLGIHCIGNRKCLIWIDALLQHNERVQRLRDGYHRIGPSKSPSREQRFGRIRHQAAVWIFILNRTYQASRRKLRNCQGSDHFTAQKRDGRRNVPMAADEGSSSTPGPGLELAAEDTPPVDDLILKEDVRVIEACVDELKPEYREVIIHHHHEGAPWARVAEWMGLPSPDAARMLNARAMLALAGLFARRRGREGGE